MGEVKLLTYIIFHPIQGFQEMKWKKRGSIPITIIIIAAWFVAAILERQLTGFVFNPYRPEKLNVLMLLPGTVLVFMLWVVSNWAFSTLLDGEGSFREIWISSAYALVPYVLFTVLATFISNFMTEESKVFLQWIINIGMYWTLILMFFGLYEVHQYTLKKTICIIGLTICGILIIVFLALLSFSLYNQVYVFFRTIFNEILYRV